MDLSKKHDVEEISVLVETAEEYLEKCLKTMMALRLFDSRQGLWEVTKDQLSPMTFSFEYE